LLTPFQAEVSGWMIIGFTHKSKQGYNPGVETLKNLINSPTGSEKQIQAVSKAEKALAVGEVALAVG
jgi:hypothetical protein